ncbi:hypothetical protein MRB53_023638 [Persea americana]|uniref:Uncharacterized protein n=1 Tax=Persea americana TaxID=3435 RepID=A0ACC2LA57_PERAE|nr:hypothetical protein MRB53_023638 [Persea americana]
MDLFVPVIPSSPAEPCYGNDGILLRGWWRSSIFVCEWALNLVEMDLFVLILPSSPAEPCYGDDGIPLRGWWQSSRFVCEWALPSVHYEWREGDRGDDGAAGLEMPVSMRGMRWRKEMERRVGWRGVQGGRWRSPR